MVLQACVSDNPEKFSIQLTPFLGVHRKYQYALLRGLYEAWRTDKSFEWSEVFDFILTIVDSDTFWQEESTDQPYDYRNWIVSTTAELIEEGTRDDKHAFDSAHLPKAERTLLILANRAQSDLLDLEPI